MPANTAKYRLSIAGIDPKNVEIKAVTIILLLVCYCTALFADEKPSMSINDIVGVFYLDRIELTWRGDAEEIATALRWFDDFRTFEVGKDYYILGPYGKEETSFGLVKKDIVEYGVVEVPGLKMDYNTSESLGYFSEFPRVFDSIFCCDGYIFGIEVIDFDTLITFLNNAYLLYRRVK